MDDKSGLLDEKENKIIHYAVQLLALSVLLVWCFRILEPFITPLVWGTVLAITLYPLHKALSKRLKDRTNWSAVIITVLMLALLIGPAVWLLLATVGEFRELGEAYRAGQFAIPPPAENVKDWPVIGTPLFNYWTQASSDLTALVSEHTGEVKKALLALLDLLGNTAKGILLFTLSIILSGLLLAYSESASGVIHSFFVRLIGPQGESFTDSAGVTVRNVAKGVLGVAVIQAVLAGIGFVLAGIPFAGLWILVCLILSIVQVGLLPVMVGVIIYIWSHGTATEATLLTIWMIFVSVIDNVLRPIMMGKGAPVPMLVVFLGAIGGFMFSGFIGLFTGAIVLTLGYKLVSGWLNINSPTSATPAPTGNV